MKYLPIYILFTLIFLSACKEEGLMTYSVEDSGSSLYFTEKINRSSKDTLMKVISLGRTPEDIKDSIIFIPVSIIGPVANQDRPIHIDIPDSATMKEGLHFDFINRPMIRANHVVDTIYLKLHRTPDLLKNRVYLKLDLKSNEYFDTRITTKINSKVEQDIISYSLSYDDMFPIPHLWTTWPSKPTFIGFFGEYSRRKVELLIEVLKIDPEMLYNPERIPKISQIVNWSSYMKYWLNKQKAEGNTQFDENNKEITMGPSA
ncbi:DUF4843 domain-containing protein [Sphingobacterium sp. DK4209]|uniref:DUF4843 domain-containing protein n=1 Tax=Sphingobacterium zhuxiongii TaxID=2662364 RepID=A0A5Q0QD75_9SPHI|nr:MULTISPECIES: DUF4843 domain-containing protein [unclassified Sphingobacterium]MVZ65664.1 DUF4843 domain-containing protein [Sphingobacterium sp. DK4209]QGA27785.1 DUF4843 domain-containing protein [Sphingobacterium sp. dk4302]